jgi:hypothetical protein
MRINAWWRIDRWLPVMRAMPQMIRELVAQPELGFLGATTFPGRTTCVVQYWRSADHIFGYARSSDHAHVPAWRAFNHRVRRTRAVGVFHETYVVQPGCYENTHAGRGACAGRAHAPSPPLIASRASPAPATRILLASRVASRAAGASNPRLKAFGPASQTGPHHERHAEKARLRLPLHATP